jgi:hypothetical protein
MSYYGYVERKPEDVQVNWGEISQGIVKSVKDWEKGREDLREKLDKETRETQKAISETPEVRDESASRFILNASTVAATKLSDLNKMLKSNKITPKEYTLRRANINSDMTEFYAFVKGFDQAYRNKTDLLKSGNMSVVEERDTQEVLKMLQGGLSNLNPEFDETGTLLLKTKDGTKSMRDVFKMGTFSYKKKDLLSEFQKLGSQVAAVDKGVRSSSRLNEEGKNTIETKIEAALSNNFDVADILNDAGHTDLFTVDGQEVKITEKGISKARQILKDAAYSAMGIKIDTPSSSGADKPTEAEEKAIRYGEALKDLTSVANKSVLSEKIGMPRGTYDGTNKVLTTYDKDGKKYETPFKSGVEAMDYLITQSGYNPAYVKRGLGGANSLKGFSWDFSAKQEATKPKVVGLVKESDDLENWVHKLNESDPTTKNKIYYSKNKTIVVKYPDGTHSESGDWQKINEYINKYNRETK